MARPQSTRMTTTRTQPMRERILDVASELFYANGIRAVGVDTVIQKAGIAKMTLYNHFATKDALVEAWIVRYSERWRAWFAEKVAAKAEEPRARLLAVFDVLEEWFRADDFRGCVAVNVALEETDPHHPAARAALEHKRAVREYLAGLAKDAGTANPYHTADQWLLLIDGATVAAVMWRGPEPARRAKQAATALLPNEFR